VFEMLDDCLPGYKAKEGEHYWVIRHPDGKRVYPSLPKGKHGAKRAEVEIGHVRKLVRLFEIPPESAEKFLPELRPK
jgi:hypothetical protein